MTSKILLAALDLWGRLANAGEAARARLMASAANRRALITDRQTIQTAFQGVLDALAGR